MATPISSTCSPRRAVCAAKEMYAGHSYWRYPGNTMKRHDRYFTPEQLRGWDGAGPHCYLDILLNHDLTRIVADDLITDPTLREGRRLAELPGW